METLPEEDPLAAPLPRNTANSTANNTAATTATTTAVPTDAYSPAHTHIKTYTAGEDGSRLQQAAKELGLAQARQPRKQVRHRTNANPANQHRLAALLQHLVLDTSTEDARIRAIYSSHEAHEVYDGTAAAAADAGHFAPIASLPDYLMDAILEEQDNDYDGNGNALELETDAMADGHQVVGGDLVSACTGIIKGMVGPAILYLPHGFASAGYLVACE